MAHTHTHTHTANVNTSTVKYLLRVYAMSWLILNSFTSCVTVVILFQTVARARHNKLSPARWREVGVKGRGWRWVQKRVEQGRWKRAAEETRKQLTKHRGCRRTCKHTHTLYLWRCRRRGGRWRGHLDSISLPHSHRNRAAAGPHTFKCSLVRCPYCAGSVTQCEQTGLLHLFTLKSQDV